MNRHDVYYYANCWKDFKELMASTFVDSSLLPESRELSKIMLEVISMIEECNEYIDL